MSDNQLFKITKTRDTKWSWLRVKVKYGGIQSAIQTYIANMGDSSVDVKVELIEYKVVGEIDMEAYRQRRSILTFVKK